LRDVDGGAITGIMISEMATEVKEILRMLVGGECWCIFSSSASFFLWGCSNQRNRLEPMQGHQPPCGLAVNAISQHRYGRLPITDGLQRRRARRAKDPNIPHRWLAEETVVFAISRPCERAKSWRSLPLNAVLLGRSGAACSQLSQTGLKGLSVH
jgi:hypothetical protein